MMQAIKNEEVLLSGKTSFKIEVPYKLIETGQKRDHKPLILYLHGYNENLKTFKIKCRSLLELEAYHLFIQGPYPLYNHSKKKPVSDWGYAWYLYDGKQKQFIKSMEITSQFIQEIADKLFNFISVGRCCVIGYSMGGYLAGYFALTRWKHITDLVVVGARIKTEIVRADNWNCLKHLRVLAVHGLQDDRVDYKTQQREIVNFQKREIAAEMKLLDGDHNFTESYIKEIKKWLTGHGY